MFLFQIHEGRDGEETIDLRRGHGLEEQRYLYIKIRSEAKPPPSGRSDSKTSKLQLPLRQILVHAKRVHVR